MGTGLEVSEKRNLALVRHRTAILRVLVTVLTELSGLWRL